MLRFLKGGFMAVVFTFILQPAKAELKFTDYKKVKHRAVTLTGELKAYSMPDYQAKSVKLRKGLELDVVKIRYKSNDTNWLVIHALDGSDELNYIPTYPSLLDEEISLFRKPDHKTGLITASVLRFRACPHYPGVLSVV